MSAFPLTQNTSALNYLYLLSKKINLGNFIQRIDALFILLWIISIFSYLGVISFINNILFKKITSCENRKMFTFFCSPVLLGLCLIPTNTAIIKFLDTTIYKYSIIILTFGTSLIILLLANLKFRLNSRKTHLN